jgi:hypothetical protein
VAAAPGNVLRDRFISVAPGRFTQSAETRQDVFGWIQENQSISLITIEPLAKGSALIWVEFFNAFLDFSQTALAAMPVPFHFNQSVGCEISTKWLALSIK